MEQLKRQINDNNNQNKKQKFNGKTKFRSSFLETNFIISSTEKPVSCFENLSNELIYEIFEYLDYFYIYDTFSNLNQRFEDLIRNSNLSIKINFSVISKSKLQHYIDYIIQPNRHRINTIHISNRFIYDRTFLSFYNFTEFIRLERLIIDHELDIEYAQNLLNQLFSLPRLSSLVISLAYTMDKKNIIYRQIFRLPALKYCQLSFQRWFNVGPLPYSTNEYSSIEHLSIISEIDIDELDRLLSYVPQLRRLSLYSFRKLDSNNIITVNTSALKCLTHVEFKLNTMKFEQFIQLFQDVFRTIEVLRLTVKGYGIYKEYINANKWQAVILTYIPKLRIFDLDFDLCLTTTFNLTKIQTIINRFTSPFWIERQWFFISQLKYKNGFLFYSITSSKSKHYTLSEQQQSLDETNSFDYRSRFNSVKYIHIYNEESLMNCRDYFPNITELIFEDHFSTPRTSPVVTKLKSILPLNQLQKLVINCPRFSIHKLIEILPHTPNLHTLYLKSIEYYKRRNDNTSIVQNQDFRFVANMNTIKYVTYDSPYKLEQIQLLVALCPRIEYLTINPRINATVSIVRFLLDKTNFNTRHLCLLRCTQIWKDWSHKLKKLFKSELLLDDYRLQQDDSNLYLWW